MSEYNRNFITPTREEMALRILCAVMPSVMEEPEDQLRIHKWCVLQADRLTEALNCTPPPERPPRPPPPPVERARLVGDIAPPELPSAGPGQSPDKSGRWWRR